MNQHRESDQDQASPSDLDDLPAVKLLKVAEVIMSDRGEVDLYYGMDMVGGAGLIMSKAALAHEFSRRSKGFQLRAIMEGWDLQRLVREMY